MQARIELGEAADEVDFEAASSAYQFRDYQGGIPEIVTVRIRAEGKYVSVREREAGQQLMLQDLEAIEDDDEYQAAVNATETDPVAEYKEARKWTTDHKA
eukprot:SAG11_NODE_30601_length_299_cov_1.040000_1_plen_99_part_11